MFLHNSQFRYSHFAGTSHSSPQHGEGSDWNLSWVDRWGSEEILWAWSYSLLKQWRKTVTRLGDQPLPSVTPTSAVQSNTLNMLLKHDRKHQRCVCVTQVTIRKKDEIVFQKPSWCECSFISRFILKKWDTFWWGPYARIESHAYRCSVINYHLRLIFKCNRNWSKQWKARAWICTVLHSCLFRCVFNTSSYSSCHY